MDEFLQATIAYCNSMIYPETGKLISQSLLGRHLCGALPAVCEFYQIKQEFMMERKEREILAEKLVHRMTEAFNYCSRDLLPLYGEDHIRVQNQATIRTTKWEKSSIITLANSQYNNGRE